MAFFATEQAELIASMPGATTATVAAVPITVDFRIESGPVQFSDGSFEMGKPFCIASSDDVAARSINNGTLIIISGTNWYVIDKFQKQDGMYRLQLSKTP